MNSEPELDALVDALRSDLPSEHDSARLRARLSALGLAASHALVSSSAAAAGTAAPGAALGAAGKLVSQAGTVSWAVKAGAVVVVSATAMTGPLWLVHQRFTAVAPAESSARAPSGRAPATKLRHAQGTPQRANGAPAELAPNEPAEAEAAERPPAPSERTTALGVARSTAGALPAANTASEPDAARSLFAAPSAPVAAGQRAVDDLSTQASDASSASFAKDDEPIAPRPTAAEPTTLREETALIDGALAALRGGDAARAAALLNQHRRRFPNGLLAQERERALRKAEELRSQRSAP